jgi:4-aminobutyrate aminotransferase
VLEREGVANSAKVGAQMKQRMSKWVETHAFVGDVRGNGLMLGVEIVSDKQKKTIAGKQRDRIVELAFERGLLFLGAGESTVRLSPPLIVTQEEADVAMDVLEECISIVEKEGAHEKSTGKQVGS